MLRILLLIFSGLLSVTTAANGPVVVTSIQPLHSLAANVMQGVGEPVLLLKGGASPHSYSLRPSLRHALNQADVVFWIGPAFETFLVKPIAATPARSIALLETPGIERLKMREGGVWESHHADEHEASPSHSDDDPHIWLDPHNAMAIANQMAHVLAEIDPPNKALYQHNAEQLNKLLLALEQELHQALAPVKDHPYIVFHDAYQYFERRFGMNTVGAMTIDPERQPGAKRIQAIRSKIKNQQARCVFSEPQFRPALVSVLLADTDARQGVLDPLGAELESGPETYFQLLRNLASALRTCLEG